MDFVNQPTYIFIKDLITLVLTIAGMIIAGGGLSTWKKQIKGDTARRLYKSVLKLREAISYVRNPFISITEQNNAIKQAEKENISLEMKSSNIVYYFRWQKITEAMSELQLEQLEAEVLWGKEVLEKIDPIRSCVTELNMKLSQFLNPDLKTFSSDEIREVIYENRSKDSSDKFTSKIDNAVNVVGNFLKPKYKL